MNSFSFKKTFGKGLLLGIPILLSIYFFIKVEILFEKVVEPIAHQMGVEKILGEITLTLFAIVLLILFLFFLGLLMRVSFIASVSNDVEAIVLKLVPSLNRIKMMAAEKLDMELEEKIWLPVLVFIDDAFVPAFVIEEDAVWVSLLTVKVPGSDPENLVIKKKEGLQLIPITLKELNSNNRQFGKGYIGIIKKSVDSL